MNPNVVITVENPATGYLKCYRPWQDAVLALGLTAVEVTYWLVCALEDLPVSSCGSPLMFSLFMMPCRTLTMSRTPSRCSVRKCVH